jgi:hypothetical protein
MRSKIADNMPRGLHDVQERIRVYESGGRELRLPCTTAGIGFQAAQHISGTVG